MKMFKTILRVSLFISLTTILLNKLLLNRYKYRKHTVKANAPREWVVNSNIVQYSSYFIGLKEGAFVETFVLLSKDFESAQIDHRQFLRCFYLEGEKVKSSELVNVTTIGFMPIQGFWKKLWRVRCSYTRPLVSYSQLRVAVVDTRECGEDKTISTEYIQYQAVKVVQGDQPKKEAVAHCVHMLREVDGKRKQRLINWLNMQRAIGISEISLYILSASSDLIKAIRKEHSDDFVKIVNHKTKFEDVCRQQIEEQIKNPDHEIYEKLYSLCEQAYQYHFTMKDSAVSNSHERINTNDCFFNYKYEYKYVTTYDIDEIIFPRNFNLNHTFSEVNCTGLNSRTHLEHNIYKYAEKVFQKFNKPPCVHFENVVFLPVNQNLANFIRTVFMHTNTLLKQVKLIHNESSNYVNYNLSEAYLHEIEKKVELGVCLNKQLMKHTSLDSTWRNVFATLMNMRRGKSIFNTDKIDGITQHLSEVPRTKCAMAPLNEGFCSHFREKYWNFFIKQTYPIDFFIVDIEYLLFIQKNSIK